ncbi:hypothetical protein Dsin_001221 [Dipteronia sinensis]|uniref:Uncharacterized protein n=1 Tax=Dipteronia sinensis TaxID=43782 RepID=A0AAE0B4W2_9ROSI|nr:hypothetical protein Dsin_001221 [Dipteronia sinensis]
MSRCAAFPPPTYVWNGASCEALLEAIKVWRENAVAEKRRKNKEKRKRKREFGELEEGEIREERRSHKHKKNKKVGETSDCQMNKEYDNEYELSETSNLTEEHDQPICDSLYDSSDNTENVKRKIVPTSVVNERPLQHIESQFRELFENFAFPPFRIQQQHPEFHDQEWLFSRRLPRSNNTTEMSDARNHDQHRGSSSLYSCAHYLPQALPYTLLF